MADGARVYPVNLIVNHHSVGPDFVNASALTIQDWFDAVGRTRGYAGVAHSYHQHPQRNKETFAQAHFAGHVVTTNKYGYELVPLMQDVWNNVAWHAGNWPINQRSIGIEHCGNYLDKILPDKALMCIADAFRAHDKAIGGTLNVTYHRMYSATQCPGRIAEQVGKIIDMINNPDKWNAILWPAPPPPPPPPPPSVPEWKANLQRIPDRQAKFEKIVTLVNMETGQVVRTYSVGDVVTVHYKTLHGGKFYYVTDYSVTKGTPYGFPVDDFDYKKPVPPPVEPPVEIPPEVPPVVTPQPEEPKPEEPTPVEKKPNWLFALIGFVISVFIGTLPKKGGDK